MKDFPFSLSGCLFALLALSSTASGQVTMEWARTYALSPNSVPVAMTLDREGNVWVVGTLADDLLTAKYSPLGTLLWKESHGDSMFDSAAAIAPDTEGNLWVAGVSSTNRLNGQITMIRYGIDGSRLWVKRFDQPIVDSPYGQLGNASDRLKLALDSMGNAYVVANASPEGGYVTTKVSPSGHEMWSRRYAAPPGYSGSVGLKGMALDAEGNVVIAGSATAGGGVSAFITVKYDSDGAFQWTAVDDWEGSSNFVTAMALDSSGNVYLTGGSVRGSYHFLTVKYSPAGEVLWVAARPPAIGRGAVARALVVDADGNVIVTGNEDWEWNEDEDIYELLTVKYDPAGREIWSARSAVNNRRVASALAVDAEGSVYVGACDRCASVPRMVILKYSRTGSQLWDVYAPAFASAELKVDALGGLYLTGRLPFASGTGYAVTKFVQPALSSQIQAMIDPPRAEAAPGGTVNLSAVVSGPGPFTYRWKRFGTELRDQTRASLTLTNVQVAGDYTVLVSNPSASTVSPEFRLFLDQPVNLSAELRGHNLVISWPAAAVGFRLQSTSDLASPNAWRVVPSLPRLTAGRFLFTTGISGSGHFYRLIRE